MAAHASTRTTQLYDQREDRVTLDEVVKINIRGVSHVRLGTQVQDRAPAGRHALLRTNINCFDGVFCTCSK
jgi:hypothetical protein